MPTWTRSFLALKSFAVFISDSRDNDSEVISVCSCGLRARAPQEAPGGNIPWPRASAWADRPPLPVCWRREAGPLKAQFTGRKTDHVISKSWTGRSVAFFTVTVAKALSPLG